MTDPRGKTSSSRCFSIRCQWKISNYWNMFLGKAKLCNWHIISFDLYLNKLSYSTPLGVCFEFWLGLSAQIAYSDRNRTHSNECCFFSEKRQKTAYKWLRKPLLNLKFLVSSADAAVIMSGFPWRYQQRRRRAEPASMKVSFLIVFTFGRSCNFFVFVFKTKQ